MLSLSKLLLWLTVQPSGWRRLTNQWGLSPHVCLADLNATQWRNVLPLLWRGFLLQPASALAVAALLAPLFGRAAVQVAAGFATGWAIGLLIGWLVHLATGLLTATVAGVVGAIVLSKPDLIMLEMATSTRYAWLLGVPMLLLLHVVRHVSEDSAEQTLRRQLGGVLLGLLISLGVTVTLVAGLIALISVAHDGGINRAIIRWVIGGIPATVVAAGIAWRTQNVLPTLATFVAVVLILVGMFGATGYEYDVQPSGLALIAGFSTAPALFFLISATLPFNLTQHFLTPYIAAVTGALASLLIYVSSELILDVFALRNNLLLAFVLMAIGANSKWVWSIVAYPFEAAWNALQYRIDVSNPHRQTTAIERHTVFLDELQQFQLFGLDQHLLLATERTPEDKERLYDQVERTEQRWATQAAQIELDAQLLEQCRSVEEIATLHTRIAAGLLTGPAAMLLFRLRQISEDVAAALAQPTKFNQRLVLQTVASQLHNLSLELQRSDDAYRERFRPIINQWHDHVAHAVEQLAADTKTSIPNPYIIGVPITRRQAVFVGRTDITQRIEGILREDDYPPLLLYGQRRMGKTSLLYQLHRLLPSNIATPVVDLQGPVALATSHAGFLFNLARGIQVSLRNRQLVVPELTRDAFADEPFTAFDLWLDLLEDKLKQQGRTTILLALDEFEALDMVLNNGVLEAHAILGMLRHIVQHRPNFNLMIAGSHTLSEFQRWSSYLINAQTLHVSFLSRAEAEQLIQKPTPNFPLVYSQDAIDRIVELTNGHPYLTQLMCTELVAHKNDQAQRRFEADRHDVEVVIPAVLERGQQYFYDIEMNQVRAEDRAILYRIARHDAAETSSQTKASYHHLLLREILCLQDNNPQFVIELIKRWFARQHASEAV